MVKSQLDQLLQKHGSVRLCGDYKITMNLNPVLHVDQYPMPTAEDLFATLAGRVVFSIPCIPANQLTPGCP